MTVTRYALIIAVYHPPDAVPVRKVSVPGAPELLLKRYSRLSAVGEQVENPFPLLRIRDVERERGISRPDEDSLSVVL